MIRSILAAAALLCPAAASAQDSGPALLHTALDLPDAVTLSGSVRARIEGIDGQFRPTGARSDQLLSSQTRLLAGYDAGPVRFAAELWDSRAYLEVPGSTVSSTEVNALELVQAYVGLDLGSTRIDVGRMTLNIGSRRLVSRQLFRNTTNGFTGAHLQRTGASGDRLDLFWTMPQRRLPSDRDGIRHNRAASDRETTDLQFFGLSYERPIGGGSTRLEAYVYGLAERDAPGFATADRHIYTPGVRISRKPKASQADFDLELSAQGGHAHASTAATDTRDLPVHAAAAHAEIGYTATRRWQPRASLVFDYGSGNRRAGSISRFDTLYGARRYDFGPTSIYGPISRSNLLSPGGRLEARPLSRLDLMAMYRALWLASATDSFGATGIRDRSGTSGHFAGQQVEARIRYALVPRRIQLETGAAILFKGRALTDAPNDRDTGDTHYGYAALTLDF